MADVRIELNSAGIQELLKSSEMQSLLKEHADQIAAGLDGYETSVYVGRTRANASVVAVSNEARKACLEDNELLNALGGA